MILEFVYMSKISIKKPKKYSHYPLILDESIANKTLDHFCALYNETYPIKIRDIIAKNRCKSLLLAIFSNSPYLTKLLFKYPDFALKLLEEPIDTIISDLFTELKRNGKSTQNVNILMCHLRVAKLKISLAIAYSDLAGIWSLNKITGTLSDFAQLSLEITVNFLINDALQKGDLGHKKSRKTSKSSGYVVIAMGKLGSYELNYSSDIDLIVLFDTEIVKYTGRRSVQDCFVKLTQKLVKIMSDRTADGYVFRTDLRLRPDPGATPVALSMEGAEIYYQSVGLNWERAAMIKARPVAGDIAAGNSFIKRIRGFVWRKHLDYAAIADIHAIKSLIHEHHSHAAIKLEGHDVKLGRGGIREIEFYAQIHQLISGGREPSLRVAPTCLALEALVLSKKLNKEQSDILQKSYVYLRTLEHRLQMINDDQTHTIPRTKENLLRITRFMGYLNISQFETEFLERLNCVNRIFNNLLQDTNQTRKNDTNLFFPMDTYHPHTLKAIKFAGFKNEKVIYKLIQNWQLGRYRACRTDRARSILKQLVPDILKAFGQHADPDAGIIKFDDFLSRLPSGVQLFSFIKAHPWLLDLLALITGVAPYLSNQLSRNPVLLDSVLSAELFKKNSSLEQLKSNLNEQILAAIDFQDTLDISRKWSNEGKFQVGLQILKGNIDVNECTKTLSYLAEASLTSMLKVVSQEFERKYGVIKNSSLCILAMGKLGGYELTTTSDVDMILIYDATDMNAYSDGIKPLSINHYYARLSQNFINGITALTGEGKLYDVDMRLRPSGAAGPLAVSVESFIKYQSGEAWTWEHMALTRARVISGSSVLEQKIKDCIFKVLSQKDRDQNNLLSEVSKMRQRLIHSFSTNNIWEMKHIRGGIIDVEFICQYLLLKYGAAHPEILKKNTLEQISSLSKARIIDQEISAKLYKATHILQSIQALLRLCLDNDNTEQEKPYALLLNLAKRFDCKPEKIEKLILNNQKFIHNLYSEIIETPAQKMVPVNSNTPHKNRK